MTGPRPRPSLEDDPGFVPPPRESDLPADLPQRANDRWRRVAPPELRELLEAGP
jgi:hypothetical protein